MFTKFNFLLMIPRIPQIPRSSGTQHFYCFNSYIYWTDWGQTPKIERARLDGTERTAFVSSGVQFPNGLAIDESDKMLYWAGTDTNKYGIIEAISLDGLNRSVILYGAGYHPFSLDVFEGFVYWSDWSKSAVLRMSKYGGGRVEVIVAGLNKPMGLKILHQRKIPPGRKLSTVEFFEVTFTLITVCFYFLALKQFSFNPSTLKSGQSQNSTKFPNFIW